MFFLFLLGLIINIIIATFLFSFSIKLLRKKYYQRFYPLFLVLSSTYLISIIFYFLWIVKVIDFNFIDFQLINSILLVFRIFIIFFLLSFIFDSDKLLIFLFIYLFVLVIFIFPVPISILFFIISFILILIISLIVYSKKNFEKVGLSGIGYSFISSIFFLIYFLKFITIDYVILILDVFLFVFLLELILVIKDRKNLYFKKRLFKEESSFIINFLRYFVFIVILVNLVFIATVSVHELGHFVTATFIECSASKIVYEGPLPHTEILCKDNLLINYKLSILGGIFLPIIISLFLFFSGGTFIHEIGLFVLGFNFLISYRDIIGLGLSDVFSLFISIIGLIIVIVSIGLLLHSRIEERNFLYFSKSHKHFYMGNDI